MMNSRPISRRDFLLSTGAGLAGMSLLGRLAMAAATSTSAPGSKRPPNVLVILADDLGYADLSCQGCKDVPTPNIDSIAKSGVRFTQAYVTAPLCSPSRAGFLTGRYQQRFGWEHNPNRGDPGLPKDERTMADYFKSGGYATGLVGKWHLGYAQPYLPLQRGFDEFFGFTYAMNPYGGDGKPQQMWRGNEQVEEKEYLTEAFTREAVDFIGRHKEKPFFLYVAYNAIHMPLDVSPRHKDKFNDIADPKRRAMATMLAALDDGVGSVLKKLRDEKLEEDTLVFFFSDNGGPTAVNASRNDPLSGGKGSVMEGGIRIPFLMQWKGRLGAGEVDDTPIISLDILPTSLSAAGLKAPEGAKLEGVNLLPYLNGKRAEAVRPHEYFYWRMGDMWAVRRGDFKLRQDSKGGPVQLFDLSKDVAEKTDLADKQPDEVKRLRAAYDKWNASNVASINPAPKKRDYMATQASE